MGDPKLDRIAHDADPVVRNRLITGCDRSLAEQISAVLWRRELNWFWLGAWASGTAGGPAGPGRAAGSLDALTP